MSTDDREAVALALMAVGDQIQAICEDAGIEIAAFVLFSNAGPMEYRSPYPREMIVKHMRDAADELEREP